MNPEFHARFTPALLAEIAGQVGIRVSDLEELKGFENYVYAFDQGGGGRILRVGHNERRPEAQVRSELVWLEDLHAGGAPVAVPKKLSDGEQLAVVDDGVDGAFIGAVFERAGGVFPEKENRNGQFYEAYGRVIGRIHALSRNFRPPPNFERPDWNSPSELSAINFLPAGDAIIGKRATEIQDRIQQLPSDPTRFGLIHQDPHVGNILVEGEDSITLFDFDDCVFGHFVYDIAMVFFYATMFDDDRAAAVTAHFGNFVRGYSIENSLPLDCFETIPLFMKLREIDLYAVIHRSFDVASTDDAWVKGFMNGRRERIISKVPWMEFDFSGFTNQLSS